MRKIAFAVVVVLACFSAGCSTSFGKAVCGVVPLPGCPVATPTAVAQ